MSLLFIHWIKIHLIASLSLKTSTYVDLSLGKFLGQIVVVVGGTDNFWEMLVKQEEAS